MPGTPANTQLWGNADVYVAPENTAGPINVVQAYAGSWAAVGLLDGDEGFTQAQENETNEFYAWGGLLVKRTRSKHKRTIKFVMLEDNATTFSFLNPGAPAPTTAAGLTTRKVTVPTNTRVALSLELRDGYNVKRRNIKSASIESVDEIKDSESGVTVYSVTVTIFPESDGTLWTELSGVNGS